MATEWSADHEREARDETGDQPGLTRGGLLYEIGRNTTRNGLCLSAFQVHR